MKTKVFSKWCSLVSLILLLFIVSACCPPFCPPDPKPDGPDEKTRLSPPTVNSPLYDCATAVTVEGFVPGAKIDIYADTTTLIGGGVSDSPWGQSFSVNPALSAGQKITATQTVKGVTSLHSKIVEVVSFFKTHPEGLPKPNQDTPLYNCGGAIGVRNLAPGGLLEVYADGSNVGKVDGCGAGQWLFVNPQFVKDQKVYATETLCKTTGPKSDAALVLPEPALLPTPSVKDVYEGGKYCTVDNITNGALAEVYNGAVKVAGHACSGGSQIFRLNPQPVAGDKLTAVQKLCDKKSDPSVPTEVKPCDKLPAPTVLPPCIGDDYIKVSGTVIDARIRIYVNGTLQGDGGGTKINLLVSLAAGDKVKATQSLDTCTSPMSSEVAVKTSAAPPYDPAFWNDPAIVECNNCYNYGCNIKTNTFAQPGYAHGISLSYVVLTCTTVGDAAKADGLADLYKEKQCIGCTHKVALVISPSSPGVIEDYHWYRLDDTGKWSHKPGPTPATNLDASGNTIANPETADRKYAGPDYTLDYKVFCTYYCVDKGKVVIDGPRSCN